VIDHIGLEVDDFERSKAFYEKTLAPLGPRPIYHENYYGAFVRDLDGNNIEAVCHLPA
jgi:predicted lactoylglutathione lyase